MIAPPAPEWVLHPAYDAERARTLAASLGAPLPIAHALVNRGVDSLDRVRAFLDPALEDLHDPWGLLDMDRAVGRILAAVDAGERILIHGDYDVDGITSTTLLYRTLAALGGRAGYRIPHRTRDGYGLSLDAVEAAAREGVRLIVTVDCGVTAVEEVARARALGIDVVVTDHHEPPPQLPDAVAIVNPLRPGCPYPFKHLAGVGVTFKLVEALLKGRGGLDRARQYLELVALGTIADVVPLVGENRVLARHGLDLLGRSPSLGMRALMDRAGVTGRVVSGGQVAFVLAPRLNAAGRVGHAEQGVRLLLSRDPDEARACAASLEDDNTLRRRYDEDVLREASRQVETLGWPDRASLMLWSDDWHAGVIGIVASRLVERFRRPAILVAMDGDRGRGSGRSLPGIDLHALLAECDDLLEAHGGHAVAAGLTVRRERLPALRERFEALVAARLTPDDIRPRVQIDADVRLAECDFDLIDWVDRLSPHGFDNPEPVFRCRDAEIVEAQSVGNGRHLKLVVRDPGGTAAAIGFHMGDRLREVGRSGRCDLAFVPSRNEWMGETRIQLKLKGVRTP